MRPRILFSQWWIVCILLVALPLGVISHPQDSAPPVATEELEMTEEEQTVDETEATTETGTSTPDEVIDDVQSPAELADEPGGEVDPDEEDPAPVFYIIRRGDTLTGIARRFNTTPQAIAAANNITNPNLIFYGLRLRIPQAGEVSPPAPDVEEPVASAMGYGVVAFLPPANVDDMTDQVSSLGMEWVRLNVFWRDLEPVQGQIDFGTLDAVITALTQADHRILLTVATSPEWARAERAEAGPPDDLTAFGSFMSTLAERYRGQVSGYQIWREPNLRREWSSTVYRIDPQAYVELLRVAYDAIKAVDSDALVITAGLAPTGFNDGVNALDDRGYLQGMYTAGVKDVSDAIAVHPGGWGNPPSATCCTAAEGVESHFDSPTFFFLDTLNDYRRIMLANGDTSPLWVTAFGWGTLEGANLPEPNEANRYILYNSLEDQALYAVSALNIAEELGFIQVMFVDNLNGCVTDTRRAEYCYHSLIAPNGVPRPAYNALSLQSR